MLLHIHVFSIGVKGEKQEKNCLFVTFLKVIFYNYEVGFHGCKYPQIAPLGVKDLHKFKKSNVLKIAKYCKDVPLFEVVLLLESLR